jgi:PAS domain S-box-containing protein
MAQIHPEDRARVVDEVRSAVRGGGSAWLIEYRFRRSDGSYAHVNGRGSVIQDAAGVTLRVIGGMQDISERVQAQEQLRQSEARARMQFWTSPFPIYSCTGMSRVSQPS